MCQLCEIFITGFLRERGRRNKCNRTCTGRGFALSAARGNSYGGKDKVCSAPAPLALRRSYITLFSNPAAPVAVGGAHDIKQSASASFGKSASILYGKEFLSFSERGSGEVATIVELEICIILNVI